MAWLAVEFTVFTLVRFAVGQWWRSCQPVTACPALYCVGLFLVMLAAPFLTACPSQLSPSLYAGFIAWTLFCSNPLMLTLAYTFEDKPKLEWQTAVMALGASTAQCMVAAACTLALTPKRFRSTFHKPTWRPQSRVHVARTDAPQDRRRARRLARTRLCEPQR